MNKVDDGGQRRDLCLNIKYTLAGPLIVIYQERSNEYRCCYDLIESCCYRLPIGVLLLVYINQ